MEWVSRGLRLGNWFRILQRMVLGVRFCILMGGGVGWEGWQNTQNIRANVERVAIIMSFQNSVLSTQYTHIP